MCRRRRRLPRMRRGLDAERRRLVADGGRDADGDDEAEEGDDADESDGDAAERTDHAEESDDGAPDSRPVDRSNVEVTDAGESTPADPKWEKPDIDDIPEFEVRADEPAARTQAPDPLEGDEDPTEGMPNEARSPGSSRIKREGTDGFIAALELAARLPDDVRLPEEAADIVPAAVEAELEQDVQSFAASEFDNPAPHVDVLEFVERDGDIWLRLRLGIPHEAFADLDPGEIRSHALQELEGIL